MFNEELNFDALIEVSENSFAPIYQEEQQQLGPVQQTVTEDSSAQLLESEQHQQQPVQETSTTPAIETPANTTSRLFVYVLTYDRLTQQWTAVQQQYNGNEILNLPE